MKAFSHSTAVFLIALLTSFGVQAELAPEKVDGAVTIDGNRAKALFDQGTLFVDPRKDSDWDAGRIPGAVHLELNNQLSQDSLLAEAKQDEEIVFYCNGIKCRVSGEACTQAVSWGFTKVYYYRTGFPDWKSRGYPVE